jgi:uncharacterized repeat protein (TIGR03803 family)
MTHRSVLNVLHVRSLVLFMLAAVLTAALAVPSSAQTYSLLYSFDGLHGKNGPWAPVILNSQGDLLGTATSGGQYGYGVFFKLKAGGQYTVLHNFAQTDGALPIGKVAQDSAGNFFGVTEQGGASDAGSIYKMDKTGTVTTLFSFHNFVGIEPVGGLVIDSAGNLYGTTLAGGGTSCTCGVVFELRNDNTYVVLHRFEGGTDGAYPEAELMRDSLGNLYGTTAIGGDGACSGGCGVVFRITPDGEEKILHRFAGPPDDGQNPNGGLVRDKEGNFYGTTSFGGAEFDLGTIFKIDAAGNYTMLYGFSLFDDGVQPNASLTLDAAGNLYGTTASGGGHTEACAGCGTVFKLDTAGTLTTLHDFTGAPDDGYQPEDQITLGSDGSVYGTTYHGGSVNAGTIFRITP